MIKDHWEICLIEILNKFPKIEWKMRLSIDKSLVSIKIIIKDVSTRQ